MGKELDRMGGSSVGASYSPSRLEVKRWQPAKWRAEGKGGV